MPNCLGPCKPGDCSPPSSSTMGFPKAEYWSGLPCPSPGDLPDPGITPRSLALRADSLPFEPPGKPCTLEVCVSLSPCIGTLAPEMLMQVGPRLTPSPCQLQTEAGRTVCADACGSARTQLLVQALFVPHGCSPADFTGLAGPTWTLCAWAGVGRSRGRTATVSGLGSF